MRRVSVIGSAIFESATIFFPDSFVKAAATSCKEALQKEREISVSVQGADCVMGIEETQSVAEDMAVSFITSEWYTVTAFSNDTGMVSFAVVAATAVLKKEKHNSIRKRISILRYILVNSCFVFNFFCIFVC